MYTQNRNFRRKGYLAEDVGKRKSYHDIAYMPNESDKAVVMFRQWLQKSSDGEDITYHPTYRDDPTETIDIFDVWNAHTSQCKNCSDAYERLEAVRKASWAVFYGCIIVSPVVTTSINTGMEISTNPWSTLVLGITSATVALTLDKFNELFLRYQVRHTDDSIIDKLPFF